MSRGGHVGGVEFCFGMHWCAFGAGALRSAAFRYPSVMSIISNRILFDLIRDFPARVWLGPDAMCYCVLVTLYRCMFEGGCIV